MERAPIGGGDLRLGLGDAGNNQIFPFSFLSNQDRRERQASLALNNPRIPLFDIYMVSHLPLERQGDELRRRWDQLQLLEEERQLWEAQSQEMNQQCQSIIRRMATIGQLVERAQSRQRENMYSNLAQALDPSASTVPVPASAPAPAPASISYLNGNPLSTLNNNSILIRQQVLNFLPSLQQPSQLIQETLFPGSGIARILQTRQEVLEAVSRPNRGDLLRLPAGSGNARHAEPIEVIMLDDGDTEQANKGDLIPEEGNNTQKCPFCSKNLSTGHMTRHVYLHCKAARKELNSRQDWQCIRK